MVTEISLEELIRLKNQIPEMRQTSSCECIAQRIARNYLSLGYVIDDDIVASKLG